MNVVSELYQELYTWRRPFEEPDTDIGSGSPIWDLFIIWMRRDTSDWGGIKTNIAYEFGGGWISLERLN